MPKVNWRAKVMYLAIVLALAIGLVPGLAAAADTQTGSGGFDGQSRLRCWIEATPQYASPFESIMFVGGSNASPDDWNWNFGDGETGKGPVVEHMYQSPGMYCVELVVTLDGLMARAHTEIEINNYLLIPGIAHNILGTEETFMLPSGIPGEAVQMWTFSASGDLGWVLVAGGLPNQWNPDLLGTTFATVDCDTIDTSKEGLELIITAHVLIPGDGEVDYQAVKKWGKINETILTPLIPMYVGYDGGYQTGRYGGMVLVPATTSSSQIIWNEGEKRWEGEIWVNETVLGSYNVNPTTDNPEGILEIPANGAIVNWWLLDSTADVSTIPASGDFAAIAAAINQLPRAEHVYFCPGVVGSDAQTDIPGQDGGPTYVTTTSGEYGLAPEGQTGVCVCAEGEEAVYVIAVANYPEDVISVGGEYPVFPEMITWNFWTQQVEKVPQVRWVEEKIVLEKFWGFYYYDGPAYTGHLVHYAISKGEGTLESVDLDDPSYFETLNLVNNADSVWTEVEESGVSRCILTSSDAGEVHVTASLYGEDDETIINQHEFVVYFLKLFSVKLSNPPMDEATGVTRIDNPLTLTVEGHNSGLWWDPENVWDASLDVTEETLNISQDALLRVRVKGYFYGNQLSGRPGKYIDLDLTAETGSYDQNGDLVYDDDPTNDTDLWLDAGYWVLPDDWARLAGPRWQELRPHWDIMDQPNDNIMSDADDGAMDKLGSYVGWGINPINGLDMIEYPVAEWPVIGPYSSLDSYTPDINYPLWRKTIVPNGELNWWDAPMPPAKIAFEIAGLTDIGFFKEVDKGDVYYKLVDLTLDIPGPESIAYTNPHYATLIPASWLIPPFANNLGYDWDSWDWTDDYGPYPYWQIIDQIPYNPFGYGAMTPDDPLHPTKVWVYSDNHGEAMMWLNGDWNLDTIGADPQNPLWKQWTAEASGTFLGQSGFEPGVPPVVGVSNVLAIADYPYGRGDQAMVSNEVTKNWTWGEQKLIVAFEQPPLPNDPANPAHPRKLIVVWVSDSNGMPIEVPVSFQVTADGAVITQFLDEAALVPPYPAEGVTMSHLPSPEEITAFWVPLRGDVPCNCAIAGAYIWGNSGAATVDVTVSFPEGDDGKAVQISFTTADMVDPALVAGLNTGTYEGPVQSVVSATSTIANELVSISWEDSTGVWHSYGPGRPSWANDLSEVAPGNIYWVNVGEDCIWNWSLS